MAKKSNEEKSTPRDAARLLSRMTPDNIENIIMTIEQNTTLLMNASPSFSRGTGNALAAGMKKNINVEAGYATAPDVLEFMKWFKREGYARRVVSIMPDEVWQEVPEVYEVEDVSTETELEKMWKLLVKRLQLWSELHRLDVLAGIGRFGILVLGLSGDGNLESPIPMTYDIETGRFKPTGDGTTTKRHLLWTVPYSEDLVTVESLVTDPADPRCGQPEFYMVKMDDVTSGGNSKLIQTRDVKVHWTRCFHYAHDMMSSKYLGTPKMEVAFNRLYDILKIAAGSGEGYWQSSNPTLVISSENALPGNFDREELKTQIWRLQNSLQKYLTIAGMGAELLSPDLTDPAPHLEVQMTLLCIGIGIPKRVFMGTEEGKLAGEQDASSWGPRVRHHRETETGPRLVQAFAYHLMACGALPWVEELFVEYPEQAKTTAKDRAEIAKLWTDLLCKYAESSAAQIVMPLEEWLHRIWEMSPDEVEELVNSAEEAAAEAAATAEDMNTDPNADPNEDPNAQDNQQGADNPDGPVG